MARKAPVATPIESSTAWSDPEQAPATDVPPTPWERALSALARAETYWLATVRPDGAPHTRPLLAVVLDEALHFCAGDRSRKARNLTADPRCSLATNAPSLDLVVEGEAEAVSDVATLQRVADAYASKYDWHPRVEEGGLWADGAPTAGPPPYRVWVVNPSTAFAFPTDGASVPTRWRF